MCILPDWHILLNINFLNDDDGSAHARHARLHAIIPDDIAGIYKATYCSFSFQQLYSMANGIIATVWPYHST